MGDAEDTFTKQEIQAGYVTSGRDVAARQQQIMAQQAAAVFGTGANVKKKVGGGGPSGTGKESKNPIFPPPTFDEPLPRKTAQSAILRQRALMQKHKGGPSAASIVAGIGTTPAVPPAPHTTLTPLKKAAAKPNQPLVGAPSDLTPAESLRLQEQRKEALAQQQQQQQMLQAQKTAKQKQQQAAQQNSNSQPNSPSHSSIGSGPPSSKGQIPTVNGVGSPHVGGISGSSLHMGAPLIGSSFSGSSFGGDLSSTNATPVSGFGGSGILGGVALSDDSRNGVIGGASLGPSSGNPFGLGLLTAESSSGGDDKWGSAGGSQNNNIFSGSGALWGGGDSEFNKPTPIGPVGGSNSSSGFHGDVGGMSLFGVSSYCFNCIMNILLRTSNIICLAYASCSSFRVFTVLSMTKCRDYIYNNAI